MVDDGIELLAARQGSGDVKTLLTYAQLCWLRQVQATIMPDRHTRPDDPDQAVLCYREALPLLRADPDVGLALLTWTLGMYADVLQARDTGTDLDLSIDVTVEVAGLLPAGATGRGLFLQRLGDRYAERYGRRGHAQDSIAVERALLASLAAPDQDPLDRASAWMRLGLLYDIRFKASGDPGDRDRSIEVLGSGWSEGSGNPLLAMSYIEALIDRARHGRIADLALQTLDLVDIDELPMALQPAYHQYQMTARFDRHVAVGGGHTSDLLAAGDAASRLIDHPATPADLRAEARVVRATAALDHAMLTRNAMADVDMVIADLEAAGDRVNPGLREAVDVQLAKALAERARRTSEAADVDRALAVAEDVLSRPPARHGGPRSATTSRAC